MTIVDEIKNIEEVAENIFKLRLPMPFKLDHINVYLLRETNRLTMIDTGLPDNPSWEALNAGLAALNLKFSDLTDIFVTHSHPDHIGQLDRIRQAAPDALLRLHRRELEMLQERVNNPIKSRQKMHDWLLSNGATELAQQEMRNEGRTQSAPHFGPEDIALVGGEKFRLGQDADSEWETMWTPGHTAGHFILYNPTRHLMLSGDHLLGRISSNIGKYPGSTPDPLGDYLNSLQKIAELDLENVLPAHGQPFSDYQARAAELVAHHRKRLDQMYAAVEGAPTTAAQVVYKIWGERLQDFDRYLAFFETMSHLHHLVLQGRLIETSRDQIIYYQSR